MPSTPTSSEQSQLGRKPDPTGLNATPAVAGDENSSKDDWLIELNAVAKTYRAADGVPVRAVDQ